MGDKMENRENQRVAIEGLRADISDGIGFFPGVLSDISRFGMRMVDLPKRLNDKSKRMTVVVNGCGRNFKMLVKPRWSAESGMRKMVGVEIINSPWAWTEFVMKYEPRVEEDVWDVINL
jgi:hypothetical protein